MAAKKQKGIVAKQLVVTKQGRRILRKLSFTVNPGTLTGLIGPSGSGKTTLMRTIVGIQVPTSGSVKIAGLEAGNKALRHQIGYVTQQPSVYEDLSVEQNLRYFASLINASSDSIMTVLKQVELVPQAGQVVNTLSGGQRARVSLAIALLGDPTVLILDEPTVGLDPILRQKLWTLFRQFADEGRVVLISSHVMDEAERCDNVMLMREGKLLWADERSALLGDTGQKTVEAAFLKKIGDTSA